MFSTFIAVYFMVFIYIACFASIISDIEYLNQHEQVENKVKDQYSFQTRTNQYGKVSAVATNNRTSSYYPSNSDSDDIFVGSMIGSLVSNSLTDVYNTCSSDSWYSSGSSYSDSSSCSSDYYSSSSWD